MLSLAVRNRPRTFNDVAGQDIVKKILKNGLKSGRLSHICLFYGASGIGKTTFSRLLALSLVCENTDAEMQACLNCENCQTAMRESHPDIFEIDAATYTGIDDIKSFLENISYMPRMSKYRIYIIDEMHMLSKSAISALLKTIEEPPAHVWFFFATTEKDKIPETIFSRCLSLQLHHLNRVELVDFLVKIAKKEGFSADRKAIEIIAEHSVGNIRLALTLLEQAAMLSGSDISGGSNIGSDGRNGSDVGSDISGGSNIGSDGRNGSDVEVVRSDRNVSAKITVECVMQLCDIAHDEEMNALYESILEHDIGKIFEMSEKLCSNYNPVSIALQILEMAQKKKDVLLGAQIAQLLELIYRSPYPHKILGLMLAKAGYLHSLPTAAMLWDAIKNNGNAVSVGNSSVGSVVSGSSVMIGNGVVNGSSAVSGGSSIGGNQSTVSGSVSMNSDTMPNKTECAKNIEKEKEIKKDVSVKPDMDLYQEAMAIFGK